MLQVVKVHVGRFKVFCTKRVFESESTKKRSVLVSSSSALDPGPLHFMNHISRGIVKILGYDI